MRQSWINHSLIVAVTLSSCGLAAAGPLDRSRVAADARWLAHLDAQAVLESTIGRAVFSALDQRQPEPEDQTVTSLRLTLQVDSAMVEHMCEALEGELHLDVRKDIKDVTIYGTGAPDNPANVVAVFSMTSAVDQLIEKIQGEAPEYRSFEAGGYRLESFRGEDGKTVYFHSRTGLDPDGRVVLVSGDAERLVRSAAVVEGKAPSLATSTDNRMDPTPQPGSFLFITASDLDWVERKQDDPGSAILQRSRGLRFDFGEAEQTMYLDAQLAAANAEDATNLTDILQGLAAMAKLVTANQSELAPLGEIVRSFTVTRQDHAITVRMRQPTDKLVDALNRMADLDDRMNAAPATPKE